MNQKSLSIALFSILTIFAAKSDKFGNWFICAACWLLFFLVVSCTECCAQKQEKDYARMRWNGAGYFRTDEYKRMDNHALNWKSISQTWDGITFATWAGFAVSGIAHGMREAYHADPYVFERRWGVSENSFFGSDAWKRNYIDNDPNKPHKHEVFGNIGRDVWHTMDEVSTWPMVGGVFTIGARRHPIKYRIANFVIGMGARTVFAFVTYNTLRR